MLGRFLTEDLHRFICTCWIEVWYLYSFDSWHVCLGRCKTGSYKSWMMFTMFSEDMYQLHQLHQLYQAQLTSLLWFAEDDSLFFQCERHHLGNLWWICFYFLGVHVANLRLVKLPIVWLLLTMVNYYWPYWRHPFGEHYHTILLVYTIVIDHYKYSPHPWENWSTILGDYSKWWSSMAMFNYQRAIV